MSTDQYGQRVAWLTLADGTQPLYLDDVDAGYFCTELDVSYPQVRDVVNNRPDQHGTDDRTALFGARTVSAQITATPGGTLTVDQIARLFSPYLDPATRPLLHLATSANDERVLTLRPADFAAPFSNTQIREIHVQWTAPDPVYHGATTHEGTSVVGSGTTPGRVYNLVFNRAYPAGAGVTTEVLMVTYGDLPSWPVVRMYGPATAPFLRFRHYAASGQPASGVYSITFLPAFRLDAGHYALVDMRAHSVLLDGDPTQSLIGQLDQSNTTWVPLPPAVAPATYPRAMFRMEAQSITQNVTHADIEWQDEYLV